MNARMDESGKPRRFTRRDSGQLAKPERTAEGFLRVEGVLARTCILHYIGPNGKPQHEIVLPEVLFDPPSMRSFAALALTNNHPIELLTPQTVGTYQIGGLGEPRQDGDRLVSMLSVLRADAIAEVERGKAELSCGYTAELDASPGTHPTLKCPECGTSNYDSIQRDRRGNHVAVVTAARAGHEARMRLDATGNAHLVASDDTCVVASPHLSSTPENLPMPTTIRLDGTTISTDAADFQQVLDRHLAAVKLDAETKFGAEKVRADAATKEAAANKTKLDGALANLAANWKRIVGKWDAMMKRTMTCDECKGAKMMDGAKCPSCDGAGSYSARDAMAEEPIAAEMGEDSATLAEAQDPGTPTPVLEAEHKDSALGKALAAAAVKRRDSTARVVKRDTAARVAFETGARKFLGTEAKLDGKPDVEVQKLVLGKTDPHMKLDGKEPAFIAALYESALARPAPTEGSGSRNDGAGAGSHGDAFDAKAAQAEYNARLAAASKPKARA